MSTYDQRRQRVETQFNINNLNITTLGSLDEFDETTRQRLATLYQDQIRQTPDHARYHFALGLLYLDIGAYPLAAKFLETAHDRDALNASILYYMALALVSGKELKTLRLSVVQKIEDYLRSAIALDGTQGHFYYLWAVLKYEYFLGNGLICTPPELALLLRQAEHASRNPAEIRHLLRHLTVTDNPILEALSP